MRILLLALLLLPLVAGRSQAVEITSIAPGAGAPGQVVLVTGGPFVEGTEILLGDQPVRPETVRGRELKFIVPPLPAGEYTLRVRGGEETPGSVLTFRVTVPTPRLRSLSPATIDTCSLLQGQPVALAGEFPAGSQVLLDGAVVPSERTDPSEIVLLLRSLKTGIHQIVVAAGDRQSIPHALVVNGVPRIEAVDQGTDYVTSYEVMIRGENFLYTSVLAVNGAPVSQAVEGDVAQNYTALHRLGGEDYLRYVDCRTLVYVRHPTTRVPKSVTLQVVNPDGEQSPVYVVVIP